MSTSTAQSNTVESRACLSGLPTEIRTNILNELSVDELIVCQQVCRSWKEAIQDTSTLAYKIALVATGMQDGPSGGSSAADRLNNLRKYQETWETDEIPHLTLPAPSGFRLFFGQDSSDAFAYAPKEGSDGSITVYRPTASFMGTAAKSWRIDTRNYLSIIDDIESYAVDVGQDLIVLTKLKENQVFHCRLPRCYLFSLSRGGAHPLAACIELRGHHILQVGQPARILVEEIAVVGDLLEWNVFGCRTEMYVFNWKTGQLMWSHNIESEYGFGMTLQAYDIRCRVIDPRYLLMIINLDMIVVDMGDFDPDDDGETPILCRLGLPPLAEGYHTDTVQCCVHRPSDPSPDCPPHFKCDSDLTVLVFKYVADKERDGQTSITSTFIVFIPLSTIRTVALRYHDSEETRAVPWDELANLGARIAVLPPDSDCSAVATLGSRVALTLNRDATEKETEVILLDLHPHARMGTLSTGTNVDISQVLLSDYFTPDIAPVFQAPVHSTLPYRVVKKTIPRGRRGGVYLMQDGIFTATVPVPNFYSSSAVYNG
ncbi:hypothetical protein C8Q80DRAFT_908996 [Daedaleopsis nitida]|nr:hypothetical protein C8Q80DRAFT_908996 [Daedaleopsis nitida]